MKDGFYWARVGSTIEVVEIEGGMVYMTGDGDCWMLKTFKRNAEFLSREPLTPPEVP